MGIGLYAGCWAFLGLFALAVIVPTKVPRELFAPPPAVEESKPAASTEEPGPAVAPQPEPGSVDLFKQLNAPAESGLATPHEEDTPAARAQDQTAQSQREAHDRAMAEWLGRAWPALVLCALVFIIGGLWLTAGKIGYLTARLTTPQGRVSEFWTSGIRAFGPLLGASALSLLAISGLFLVGALIVALFAPLLRPAPEWLRVLLAVPLFAAMLIGLVWVGVRLSFWPLAIVRDRLGPINGLKASFKATRGRWWRTCGLSILLGLISMGVQIVFALLAAVVGLLGGITAGLLGVIGLLLYAVAKLFLEFTRVASFLHFYAELHPPSAS